MTSKKCPGCETIVLREEAYIIANQRDGLIVEYVCASCMVKVRDAYTIIRNVFTKDPSCIHMGSLHHAVTKFEDK